MTEEVKHNHPKADIVELLLKADIVELLLKLRRYSATDADHV